MCELVDIRVNCSTHWNFQQDSHSAVIVRVHLVEASSSSSSSNNNNRDSASVHNHHHSHNQIHQRSHLSLATRDPPLQLHPHQQTTPSPSVTASQPPHHLALVVSVASVSQQKIQARLVQVVVVVCSVETQVVAHSAAHNHPHNLHQPPLPLLQLPLLLVVSTWVLWVLAMPPNQRKRRRHLNQVVLLSVVLEWEASPVSCGYTH